MNKIFKIGTRGNTSSKKKKRIFIRKQNNNRNVQTSSQDTIFGGHGVQTFSYCFCNARNDLYNYNNNNILLDVFIVKLRLLRFPRPSRTQFIRSENSDGSLKRTKSYHFVRINVHTRALNNFYGRTN